MAIFIFIAKLILSSGLLYGYYHFFLRNKRFHHYNRFYLLAAAVLSFIIPFVYIPVHFFGGQQQTALIQTLKVINVNGWEEPVIIYARNNAWSQGINVQTGLGIVYIAGLVTGLVILFRSLAWITRLKEKYDYEIIDELKIYNTSEPGTPFSFFKSIFWDENISLHDNKGQQIFRHELFHVKEKHSADVLLIEIACCIAWFNPFFHLIRKEIRAIHEFLADEYAVSASNRYEYAELLVTHAISQKSIHLAHPFFHNQIKRRITMITQSNLIRRSGYISRMMALPLLFMLVSAFAVKITNNFPNGTAVHYANKKITVVIDAGHGGIYPGAHGADGAIEKNITLDLAKKINELAASYNVTVKLTRNNDALAGNATDLREDLLNRVKITNDANADLFISIHVNAGTESISNSSGFEAYISKKRNDEKSRLLASALLTGIKNIYPVFETIQQREVGVTVIDQAVCPAVLLECGFITTPKDVAFITNPANQEAVARKILEGIVVYSNVQGAGASAFSRAAVSGDTISAEELAKISINDIKSVDTDLHTNVSTVYLKNGDVKYAHAAAISKFYAANRITDTIPAAHGTEHKSKDADTHTIFTKVEFEPDYVGGEKEWIAYLIKNVHYPKEALAKKLEGTVVVEFIVDTNGKISDVKAINGPKELQAESIRVVKESGTWVSAVQNGKKVKAYKRQPITYKLG